MLRKGCGKMAMDNSCTRITGEGSEHPPLTSCSKKATLKDRKSGQFICYKSGQFYLLLTIKRTVPFILHKTKRKCNIGRHIGIYLCKHLTGGRNVEIGKMFGIKKLL